jgi:hypothetical protein
LWKRDSVGRKRKEKRKTRRGKEEREVKEK